VSLLFFYAWKVGNETARRAMSKDALDHF